MASFSPPRLVVSLTTIPSRIDRIEPTLRSLARQSVQPAAIYLNLPKESRREKTAYRPPAFLERYPQMNVNWCDQDWGPATKLFGVLSRETDPATCIVTVDDDKQYHSEMLADYLHYAPLLPHCALGRRGWILRRPELTWPNMSYLPKTRDIRKPVSVDVLTGVGSVLYRRGFFDDNVMDYSDYPGEAFFVDDICICGYLARKRIPRVLIPSTLDAFHYTVTDTATDPGEVLPNALWKQNKDGHNNNTMIAYFRDDWGAWPPKVEQLAQIPGRHEARPHTRKRKGSFVKDIFDKKFYAGLGIRKDTMRRMLTLLEEQQKDSYVIVQTGISRKGLPSLSGEGAATQILDQFVNYYDGVVWSVDPGPHDVQAVDQSTSAKTVLRTGDPAAELRWLRSILKRVDCLYIDSMSLNWNAPEKTAELHLKELLAIKDLLVKGSVLVIDDSPLNANWLPPWIDSERRNSIRFPNGKGLSVIPYLQKHMDVQTELHQYQAVFKVLSPTRPTTALHGVQRLLQSITLTSPARVLRSLSR
jgi:hypothetical protein